MSRASQSAMCLFKGKTMSLGSLTARRRTRGDYAHRADQRYQEIRRRQSERGRPLCAWCGSADTARDGIEHRLCGACGKRSLVIVEMESVPGHGKTSKVPVTFTEKA